MLSILLLVINSVAVILGGALLLRFWMQAIRVRPPAQVAQFTFTLSDWLVRPMRRVVPGVGGYDWASLIGAFLVVALATSIYLLTPMPPEAVAKLAVFRFLTWIVYGFIGLMFVEVIFSWVNPHAPLAPFVRALNEPLARPLRRIIPPLGGLDLSLAAAMILLLIVHQLLAVLFGYGEL